MLIQPIKDFLSQYLYYPHIYCYDKIIQKPAWKLFKEKLELQKKDENYLKNLQFEKLKSLLILAYEKTTYYNKIFNAIKFNPHRFSDIEEMKKIPILTKNIIQKRINDLIVKDAPGIYKNSSGGSTGVPLHFYHDLNYRIESSATSMVSNAMQGWYPGARVIYLWGAPADFGQSKNLKERILEWLKNEKFYDAFDMGPTKMKIFYRQLSKFRPHVLIAYASSIFIFAKFIQGHNLKTVYPCLSIISSAEVLTEKMRKTIEKVFNLEVFNRYGSREVGCIASECFAHQGLHLHPYDHYLEVINPATGEFLVDKNGKIIITALNNYAMPFIRYEIGDMGELTEKKCICGRPTKLLKKITGRISDSFTTKNGDFIHGEYFTHIFYKIDGIKKFQLIQEDLENLTLNLIKKSNFKLDVIAKVKKEIIKVMGNVNININFVSAIALTKSGKYLFTISKVPIDALKR